MTACLSGEKEADCEVEISVRIYTHIHPDINIYLYTVEASKENKVYCINSCLQGIEGSKEALCAYTGSFAAVANFHF